MPTIASEVGVEHAVRQLASSGVIDQPVERTDCVLGAGNQSGDFLFPGKVCRYRNCLGALAADGFSHLERGFLAKNGMSRTFCRRACCWQIVNGDVAALLAERNRDRASYARVSTGNEIIFAGKAEIKIHCMTTKLNTTSC